MLVEVNSESTSILRPNQFRDLGILEREIEKSVCENPEILGEDLLVIGSQVSEWTDSRRSIDVLSVDKSGNLVVIELKRTATGDHMDLQSLRYAAMISTLTFEKSIKILAKFLNPESPNEAEAKLILENFIDLGDAEEMEDVFASDVRIILVGQDFSSEITQTVIWLNDRNIDIRCVKLTPYEIDSRVIWDVQQIIPLPEAAEYQTKLREQNEERKKARESKRDFTKYEFDGQILNKRRLVLAVVMKFISNQGGNISRDQIETAFPRSACGNRDLLVLAEDALRIFHNTGKNRHFIKDTEIVRTSDGEELAILNQWGSDSFDAFLSHAKQMRFEIVEKEAG